MSSYITNPNSTQWQTTQSVYGSPEDQSFNWGKWRKTMEEIEMRLRENPTLKGFHKKTGFPLVYIVGGLLMLMLSIIYMFSGLRVLLGLVGVIYPGYMSLKAIKNDNKLDNMLWLSYWIWYGLFTLIESITDILLFWIPMYQFMKMAFYVYLYAPNTKGALFLYRKVLQPLVIRFQQYEYQFIKNVQEVKKKYFR
jgi:receptor expression-enhancing protein 5/6